MINFSFLQSKKDFEPCSAPTIAAKHTCILIRRSVSLTAAGHGVCGEVDVLDGQAVDRTL